jgi:diaminopimelate epimerase
VKGHLYDAAGNRILWLDARDGRSEPEYDKSRIAGFELSRRFELGQDLTAVLFGSAESQHALFWNADGSYEMICGNALRCLAHFICTDPFPHDLVSVETQYANYLCRKVDATHGCVVIPARTVRVGTPERDGDLFVDAGTPHRIRLVKQEWLEHDLVDATSHCNGANAVNFDLVRKVAPFQYRVRTFERGVGETSSCGTAAVSIVAALNVRAAPSLAPQPSDHLEFASGEQLSVTYDPSGESYEVAGRVALLQDLSK